MRRITRAKAIDELREVLLGMVDDQNSLCRVAAWRRLFCHGFRQWDEVELEQRFPTLPRGLARGHQELRANSVQLGRQDVRAGKLPCDCAADDHSAPCAGWDEFDDRTLARFHREILGRKIQIVPQGPPAETPDTAS